MEGLNTDKQTLITEYIIMIESCHQEYKPEPRSITVYDDDESGKITRKKEEEEPIIILFSKTQRLLKDDDEKHDQELNNKN